MKNNFLKLFLFAVLILTMINLPSIAQQAKPELLTNKNIVEITKAGLDEDIIISKITTSSCKFDVSTNALIDLKKQGVSKSVISAMMNKNNGQSLPNVTVPNEPGKTSSNPHVDLINYVHAYSMGKVTPLEKLIAASKTKTIVLGYGGHDLILEVEGATSPVKLSENASDSFLINTGGNNLPDLALFKLKVNKNKRQAVAGRLTMSGPKSGDDIFSVEVTKLAEGLYRLKPTKRLEKGEYFFTNKPNLNTSTSSAEVYAFSVQ